MTFRHRAWVVVATAAVLAACSHTPDVPAPASDGNIQIIAPQVVDVLLDVDGTGTGTITHSTATGHTITTHEVLHGWTYSYAAPTSAQVVLHVQQTYSDDVRCAVHINSELRATDRGATPSCTQTAV